MKNKRLACAVFILGLFIFTAAVYSAEPEKGLQKNPPAASALESSQPGDPGADIIILMDSSGSMKKTDPRNYRKDSARLFISLLGADDNVGIISFGDSAKTLIPLTANSRDNRTVFIKAISRITSKELTTDITGAVEKGVAALDASKRKNRVLIIMSDGKLDLGDPDKEKSSLEELGKLLPEIKKAGIKLYSIAFSELSDQKLLADMAEKTGGFFRYAAADKDIHLMFASIFEKIKSPDSVALEGDAFSIDQDVKETVLLITKQAGTATVLLDPAGKKIVQGRSAKNIQWYSSSVFDMITIQEPMTGKWKVRLSSREGNKIFVLTNLKLKSSFVGNNLNKGDKAVIDAWLEKDEKRITDKEVLSQISFFAEIIDPAGKSLKMPLAGGEGADAGGYSVTLNINQPGDYTVRLAAEGKAFNRTKDILFKAVEPTSASAVQLQPPQAAAKTEPSTQPETVIDWETAALVLASIILVLIVLAGYLYVTARKYKKLYISSQGEGPVLQMPTAQVETAAASDENYGLLEAESVSEVQDAEIGETGEVNEATSSAVIEVPVEQVHVETAGETGGEEGGPDSGRIEKLLGIIEFQKNKIAELMFVKDTFENARVRLSALQSRDRLMQDQVKSIAESYGITEELKEPLSALEDDTSELVSYILVFEKEEKRLAEKFVQWEEELNRLMAGEQFAAAISSVGSEGVVGKISELEEKLREAQDEVMSKERRMQALQTQYEDIEKEYMILYHAAQKQQKQPDV